MSVLAFVPLAEQPHSNAILRCATCGDVSSHVFLSRLELKDLECPNGHIGALYQPLPRCGECGCEAERHPPMNADEPAVMFCECNNCWGGYKPLGSGTETPPSNSGRDSRRDGV